MSARVVVARVVVLAVMMAGFVGVAGCGDPSVPAGPSEQLVRQSVSEERARQLRLERVERARGAW